MTDRELLEAAAKAYWGSEIDDTCSIRWLDIDSCIGYTHGENQDHNGCDIELCWNPLEYDAEAFRLAVKLRLDIDNGSPSDGNRYVCAYRCGIAMVRDPVSEIEEIEDECQRLAATRRAIVRAAAEIGAAIEPEQRKC